MIKGLLAIDPGSNEVGLYWGPGRSRTLYLTDQSLSKSKRAQTPRPERLANLLQQLDDFIDDHKLEFQFAAYEEQFVRGGGATKALFGAVGVAEAAATRRGLGMISIPQSTVRKWTMRYSRGEGGAKGGNSACAKYHEPMRWLSEMTEHERDACAIWYYMQENGEVDGR